MAEASKQLLIMASLGTWLFHSRSICLKMLGLPVRKVQEPMSPTHKPWPLSVLQCSPKHLAISDALHIMIIYLLIISLPAQI